MKGKTVSFLVGGANWLLFSVLAAGLLVKKDARFRFGKVSEDNLKGVNPALVRLARRALELSSVDFTVVDGVRSLHEHEANLKAGSSTTARSSHIDGLAIDTRPIGGWNAKQGDFYAIARAFRDASEELGIGVRWGGSWKPLLPTSDIEGEAKAVVDRKGLFDPGHFELWPKKWNGSKWEWVAG